MPRSALVPAVTLAGCLAALLPAHASTGRSEQARPQSEPRRTRPATRGTSRLTVAQQSRAVRLAEERVAAAELAPVDDLNLVSVHWFHDKESRDTKALVTHYRTRGDFTIRTRVNLTRDRVEHHRVSAHSPTGLSRAEFERARALALRDEAVVDALAGRQVVVEPMVVRSASPEDPLFGHRVVRLLFKLDRSYLRRPVVFVDLTEGTVLVESKDPESVE